MSFQLSPTNRSQIVSTGDRFVVAVAGDFRGGQLHVQFSIDGVFASQGNEGIHVFETAGLRSFESNGEDIKLLWVGEAGAVDVTVTGIAATSIQQLLTDLTPHGRLLSDPLGRPSVRRVVTAGAASASVALTTACRRASIIAIGADIRFEVSSGSPTASATTHLILEGERLDIHLPATPSIAAIRNGAVNGTLEITELVN